MVWYGMVWYGMVWYGMVWYGMVWYGMVWYGMVWYGVVWCGVVWCGVVWCGVVWCGVVWCGVVRCGAVRCGAVRCYVVWCYLVWCGVVCCGAVWCGFVCCSAVHCNAVWCGVVWCDTVLWSTHLCCGPYILFAYWSQQLLANICRLLRTRRMPVRHFSLNRCSHFAPLLFLLPLTISLCSSPAQSESRSKCACHSVETPVIEGVALHSQILKDERFRSCILQLWNALSLENGGLSRKSYKMLYRRMYAQVVVGRRSVVLELCRVVPQQCHITRPCLRREFALKAQNSGAFPGPVAHMLLSLVSEASLG